MKKLFTLLILLVAVVTTNAANYEVVGVSTVCNDQQWNNDAAENLMTTSDGGATYTLTIENVTLETGTNYEYKIVEKGYWNPEYYPNSGGGNASFSVAASGIYTIEYVFTVSTSSCVVNTTKTGEAGAVTHTYTVAGVADIVNGDGWSPTNTDNDMTTSDNTTYTLTVTNATLYTGTTYEYKIVQDHAWAASWPSDNKQLTVDANGIYTITFTFNSDTKAVSHSVNKTGDISITITSYTIAGVSTLMGSNFDPADTDNDMTETPAGSGVWKLTRTNVALAAGEYNYKATANHTWGVAEYPSGNNNYTLNIANEGLYNVTFTLTPSESTLTAEATLVPGYTAVGCLMDGTNEVNAPGFVGDMWAVTATANDLTETSAGSGVWTKTYTGVPAGTYAFKVAKDHSWATAYPAANYEFTLTDASNVTVYYHETGNFVTIKVGDAWYDKWTVVGTLANVNGETEWAATETANDMTSTDGVNFALSVTGKTLYKGSATYEYKVARNHAGEMYPSENASLPTVSESGVYTINYTFNAATKAVNAVLEKTGVAYDYVDLQGAEELFGGAAWNTRFRMSTTDGTTYTYTIEDKFLAAQDYGYKAIVNYTWTDGYVFPSTSSTNTLTISTAATYNVTITFNNSTKELTAVATPVVSWTVAGCLNDGENEVDAPGFFGTKWAATATANDLTETSAGSGVWTKTYTGVPAGNYEFKVAYSHTWDAASYPAENLKFTVPADDATVQINFYEADNTIEVKVNDELNVARWSLAGTEALFGAGINTSSALTESTQTPGTWVKTYSNVPAGDYSFKVIESGTTWHGDPDNSWEYFAFNVAEDNSTVTIIWNGTTCNIVTAQTFIVAGNSANVFGTAWDETLEANKLTLVDEENGIWSKTYTDVPAGDYEFKIVENKNWDTAYPTDNYEFTLDAVSKVEIFMYAQSHTVAVKINDKWYSADTWTLVGAPQGTAAGEDDVLFTKTWDETQTVNDLEQTDLGVWTKTYSNVALAAGTYEYKVAKNHAWDESYPAGNVNQSFEVKLAGNYDVTFTYNANTPELTAVLTLVGADYYLAGTTFGWSTHDNTNKFAVDNGKLVLNDVALEMGAEFKLWDGADLWIGAQSDGNYWLNDTNKDNITMLSGDGENIYLAAAAGTYTVTFNPNTFKLSVAGTFGEPVKTLAFGATGYLTFGDLRNSFSFDGKGVDVYTVTYDADGMARRHAVESKQVPVGTGVLLYHTGGAGEVEIPIIGTPAALTDNNLLVSDGTVEGSTNRYCLAADSTPLGVGFYPVAASVTIPAGKAYLEITVPDPSNAPARIWFDGETTAIDSLNGETGVENDGTVYDLNGRRVNGTLSRGLYIKNGKKFIVK